MSDRVEQPGPQPDETSAERLIDDNPPPRWWFRACCLAVILSIVAVLWWPGRVGQVRTSRDARGPETASATARGTEDLETAIRSGLRNDSAMTSAAGLFRHRCAQCHRADGRGGIGPNLTDDAWIHVDRLEDVHRVISRGVPQKGMPGWRNRLTDQQLIHLAAYVARLSDFLGAPAPPGDQGSPPAPG